MNNNVTSQASLCVQRLDLQGVGITHHPKIDKASRSLVPRQLVNNTCRHLLSRLCKFGLLAFPSSPGTSCSCLVPDLAVQCLHWAQPCTGGGTRNHQGFYNKHSCHACSRPISRLLHCHEYLGHTLVMDLGHLCNLAEKNGIIMSGLTSTISSSDSRLVL